MKSWWSIPAHGNFSILNFSSLLCLLPSLPFYNLAVPHHSSIPVWAYVYPPIHMRRYLSRFELLLMFSKDFLRLQCLVLYFHVLTHHVSFTSSDTFQNILVLAISAMVTFVIGYFILHIFNTFLLKLILFAFLILRRAVPVVQLGQ